VSVVAGGGGALNAVTLGAAAGLAALAGAWAVARRARRGLAAIELFVCFSAGFMIALALVAAIPEAIQRHPRAAAPVVLLGYLLVHLSQHTLTPHFHFGEETHRVSAQASRAAMAGLVLHTFFDGVAIASLVLASGGTARGAYYAAGYMGLATVLGALLTGMSGVLSDYGLALAAGVTLYVGASNLVPEFQHRRGVSVPLAFVGGAGAFLLARALLARLG